MYTTIEKVASELKGVSITSSTSPSDNDVKTWIYEATKEIDALTGRVWSKTTVTSDNYEYHDYDGAGYIKLYKYPVISVESVEYEEKGLGSEDSASWVSLVEGRGSDANFIVYKDEGVIKFHGNSTGNAPIVGKQNIRVTYTYGYDETPDNIVRFATLLVAKRFIQVVASGQAGEGGGSVSVGVISVSDPNNYVFGQVNAIDKELSQLRKDVIPTLRVFDDEGNDIL